MSDSAIIQGKNVGAVQDVRSNPQQTGADTKKPPRR